MESEGWRLAGARGVCTCDQRGNRRRGRRGGGREWVDRRASLPQARRETLFPPHSAPCCRNRLQRSLSKCRCAPPRWHRRCSPTQSTQSDRIDTRDDGRFRNGLTRTAKSVLLPEKSVRPDVQHHRMIVWCRDTNGHWYRGPPRGFCH